jgi:hypothetical protein
MDAHGKGYQTNKILYEAGSDMPGHKVRIEGNFLKTAVFLFDNGP